MKTKLFVQKMWIFNSIHIFNRAISSCRQRLQLSVILLALTLSACGGVAPTGENSQLVISVPKEVFEPKQTDSSTQASTQARLLSQAIEIFIKNAHAQLNSRTQTALVKRLTIAVNTLAGNTVVSGELTIDKRVFEATVPVGDYMVEAMAIDSQGEIVYESSVPVSESQPGKIINVDLRLERLNSFRLQGSSERIGTSESIRLSSSMTLLDEPVQSIQWAQTSGPAVASKTQDPTTNDLLVTAPSLSTTSASSAVLAFQQTVTYQSGKVSEGAYELTVYRPQTLSTELTLFAGEQKEFAPPEQVNGFAAGQLPSHNESLFSNILFEQGKLKISALPRAYALDETERTDEMVQRFRLDTAAEFKIIDVNYKIKVKRAQNVAPSLVLNQTSITSHEDASGQAVEGLLTVSAGPALEANQSASVTIVNNSNPYLFTQQPSIDSNYRLTYKTAANAVGQALISFQAKDNGGTVHGGSDTSEIKQLTINVLEVNDPPTFNLTDDELASVENDSLITNSNWADFSAGPASEASQTLQFEILSITNAGLFAVQPSIDQQHRLSYQSAADTFGESILSIRVRDSGGTERQGQDVSETKQLKIKVVSFDSTVELTPP